MRRVRSARVEAMECTPQEFGNIYNGAALILYEIKGGELKRPVRIRASTTATASGTLFHESAPKASEGMYDPELFEDRRFRKEAFVLLESGGPKNGRTITIGRTGNSDVVINDYTVSASHAIFDRSYQGAGPHLGCVGGRNGTFVNSDKVNNGDYAPLNTGDLVRLGRVEMIYVAHKDLYSVLRDEVPECRVSALMGWGKS